MIIMKSKEVLELLQITRPTLTKYVKEGLIKLITLYFPEIYVNIH